MRLIDADAFDKCLEDAEDKAIHMQKYVFASALNTIRGNLRTFPAIEPEREKMADLIDRQAAIDAINRAVTKEAAIRSVESLPSVQSEPCEDAEFWQKRAEHYSKICLDLIAGMNQGVKIDSIEINEEGINFKMTQPEPCEDAVSRNAIFKNLTRWIDTTQANSEELRRTQKNSEELRRTQKNSEELRRTKTL